MALTHEIAIDHALARTTIAAGSIAVVALLARVKSAIAAQAGVNQRCEPVYTADIRRRIGDKVNRRVPRLLSVCSRNQQTRSRTGHPRKDHARHQQALPLDARNCVHIHILAAWIHKYKWKFQTDQELAQRDPALPPQRARRTQRSDGKGPDWQNSTLPFGSALWPLYYQRRISSQAAKILSQRLNITPVSITLCPPLPSLRSQRRVAARTNCLAPFGCGREAALCCLW